jgi:hypothetical protein
MARMQDYEEEFGWQRTPRWMFWMPTWRRKNFVGLTGADDGWEYQTARKRAYKALEEHYGRN